jgi:hypothetical protein
MSEAVLAHILDAIPFEPDVQELQKHLRIKPGSPNETELMKMLQAACRLAQPRAVYLAAYITGRDEEWVEIEGMRFTSRVLSVNLEHVHRVFPYLITCGPELQEWGDGFEDMLQGFWAEAIKESALFCAGRALEEDLQQRYQLDRLASMNPGSLTDWPIQQQRVLFDLFGVLSRKVGVRLTDSLLMIPTKSVSGIHFPTEVSYANCQLCPRENCPNRRASYEPGLFESKYQVHPSS